MDVIYRRQKVGDCNSATDGAVAPAYFWKVHHQQQSSLSIKVMNVGSDTFCDSFIQNILQIIGCANPKEIVERRYREPIKLGSALKIAWYKSEICF